MSGNDRPSVTSNLAEQLLRHPAGAGAPSITINIAPGATLNLVVGGNTCPAGSENPQPPPKSPFGTT